jgi:hypothetical protein
MGISRSDIQAVARGARELRAHRSDDAQA